MFETSPVFESNYKSTAKININQGGTSSSKTYSLMQLLCYKAVYEPRAVITITGESIPNLKKGAYRDTETIYTRSKYLQSQISFWNKSDRIIYFKNGSLIEFVSNLNEQSAKNGKRDYLFCNEANGISWLIFFQLAIRTRKTIYIDYNPTAPFWAHEKLIGTGPESNDLTATVQLFISDHRHNPFLTEEEHRKIEGIKDPELWKVYARGLTGKLTGLIFPEWQSIPDTMFPKDEPFFGGLDFGYTNDPTAAVKIVRIGETLYIHEMCYTPGIAPIQMKQIFESNGFNGETIFCEHDPDQVAQLRRLQLRTVLARKGQGSVNAGIIKLKEYKVFYTESSHNLKTELSKYMWEIDEDTGKPTNTPVDAFNHCFTGDTLITTIDGLKRIDSINEGDLVLTRVGYRPVLKVFNNGLKTVNNYSMQFDTFSVNLKSTYDHKIKTLLGWEKISKLKPSIIYLHKHSTVNNTGFIPEKNIFREDVKKCMLPFMNFIMVKSKKAFTYIIRMGIVGITKLITWNLLLQNYIYQITSKKGLKIIRNGQNLFGIKEFLRLKNGTNRKKESCGISNMQENAGSIEQYQKKHVSNVDQNTKQNIKVLVNSAITIARLKHCEQGESSKELVYDLMIEGQHEYFANGILVHNCIDAIRYAVYSQFYRQ